jgi:hypothetical protein
MRPLLAAIRLIVPLAVMAALGAADPTYEFQANFLTPPPGHATIGNGHGEIRVDSLGNIYVSVDGVKEGGLQKYSPTGTFIGYVPNTPSSLHGFIIRQEDGQDVIYAAVLGQSRVLKLKTDGTILLEIPKTAFPADKPGLKLTSVDVAPNGDIYVVDGYGKSFIFVFDKAGTFKTVFGGPGEPWKFANTHKIFMDHRFEPVRLFCCDRGNNRILHLALDGTIIGVIKDQGMRRPSSASFFGDLVCIAEIEGRISVLDKEGKTVAMLGINDTKGQTNTPKVKPEDWRDNVVTSPHGITFDAKGNIMECEWNEFGRVLRWNLK